MTALLPAPSSTTLAVRPWPDAVIDRLGHDPRSAYVETFWLGIIGPSTAWLLRRLVAGLDAAPSGFDLDLADTARALGLGDKGGRHSPFMRSLGRLAQFELAQLQDEGVMAVRRRVPPLSRRQVLRLPDSLQAAHLAHQEQELRVPQVEHLRRQCRRMALSLLELGEDLETAERQLLRWRYHPALARDSALWAWHRHQAARGLAATTPPTWGAAPGSSPPAATPDAPSATPTGLPSDAA